MQVLLAGRAPEPLTAVKEHTHPQWEIVVVTHGSGGSRTARERFEFQAGDVYVVPPNTPHAVDSAVGFTDIFFHMDKLPFQNDVITLVLQSEESPMLAQLMYSLYLRKGRCAALDSLGEVLVQLAADRLAEEHCHPLSRSIRNYLIRNCSDPEISMGQLAVKFGYTDDHLRRCFKEDFQMTPLEYLLQLRLGQAKRLLRMMPVWSVEEIARQCGFEDPLYFSRVFKKAEGISPRQFRKEN